MSDHTLSYHTMSTWLLILVCTIAVRGAYHDLRSWRTVPYRAAVVVVLACGHGVFARNAASGRAAFRWLVCALAMGKPPGFSRFPHGMSGSTSTLTFRFTTTSKRSV